MVVADLLKKMTYEVVQGTIDRTVSELVFDSRKACKDAVFVCISGAVVDGHTFVEEVVQKGVTTVIVEKEVTAPEGVTVVKVESTRLALACMSAAYFGNPAEQLKTIVLQVQKEKQLPLIW